MLDNISSHSLGRLRQPGSRGGGSGGHGVGHERHGGCRDNVINSY